MLSQDAVLVFFYLHLVALIFISLLLLTILFSQGTLKKDPTVISLLVIYGLISPIAYDLTLFKTAGRSVDAVDSSSAVCLAQAGVTAGLQSMQAAAILALVVKLFSTLLAVSRRTESFLDSSAMQVILICLPYVVWLTDLVATVVVATDGRRRSKVVFEDFYCRVDHETLTTAFAALDVIFFSLVATFLVFAIALVIRRFYLFRRIGGEVVAPSSLVVAFSEVDMGLSIRVVLFVSYIGVAFGTSTLILTNRSLVIWDLTAAAAGPIIFLVFGSQTDVLTLWLHPFRLLVYYFLKLLCSISPSHPPPPPTPTLRTDSPDPFPPQTVYLPSLPLSLHAPPPSSPTKSLQASLHTSLTRGSSFTGKSTREAARTPSPGLWTKDGRWRTSLFLEEGGTAKEMLDPEEERWRREDRELAKELMLIKREVGMVKSELVEIRREVGERGGGLFVAAEERMETEGEGDARSDASSVIEEDDDDDETETEEDEEGEEMPRRLAVSDRPPTPAFR